MRTLLASDQIPVRDFDREMIVVAHDDEGMEEPVGFLTRLEQALLKPSARYLVAKHLGAVVTTIQHLIADPGKCEPQLARYRSNLVSVETRATLDVKT